ncbi:D(2) dopamine receptor B-like [Mizuhopecten yessoensis]|uniref:Neuromedin-U receptor 2 n=1 Tax=Mizuhopecten yessoensis TaxID=6573 RepID=A0A210QK94_MIZYE|nr:D(2) dopamine receptor B-like [Mizuhopecten yessoensis]XP_021356229.1 D(2) dopamine receptor B-like [Mizuhopecten yessoensis]OWF49177.1 Neuromedin-U receptor 2 [Mizuhopecten yessoensis]
MATLSEINAAEAFRQFPLSVYLSVLSLVGLVGNSIVLYIYTKVYTNSNSRSFIRFLSTVDLMTCVVAVPVEILTVLNQYEFDNPVACVISRFVNSAGTVSASTILILIAIDRYRKICQPLEWQISNKRAKILSVCSMIFGVVFSIPNIFLYGVRTREVVFESFVYNGTECSVSDAWSESRFPLINNVVTLLMFIVSAVTLVTLYSIIGRNVRFFARRQEQRKNSSVVLDTHSGANTAVKRRVSEMRSQDGLSADSVCENPKRRCRKLPIPEENNQTLNQSKSSDQLVQTLDREQTLHEIIELETDLEQKSDSCDSKDNAYYEVETGETIGSAPIILINCSPKTKETTPNIRTLSDSTHTSISKISSLKTKVSSVLPSNHRHISRDTSRQNKNLAKSTTYLMFIISMVFILNFVPYLLLVILRELKDDFVDSLQNNDAARTAYRFFLRSYFANCAVNPIIYSIFDRRFRQACKQTLRSVILKCFPAKC